MELVEITAMMSALAHATRYRCYALLVKRGYCTAGELADGVGVPKSLLSSHVSILLHAGLVTSERKGRSVVYYPDADRYRRLVSHLAAMSETSLGDH